MYLQTASIIVCVLAFCPLGYCDMEEYLNKKYVMVSHENFDSYLIYLGHGYFARKIALAMRPEMSVSSNSDGTYSIHFESKIVNSTTTFNLDEEYVEVRLDGAKLNSTVTFEDNKLIQTQRQDGEITKHIWEFTPEKLTITTIAEGLNKKVIRHFVIKNK